MNLLKYLSFIILSVSVSLLISSCQKAGNGEPADKKPPVNNAQEKKGDKERAFPVEVKPVESAQIEYSVSAVGSVEAFEYVQITARVAGIVEKVYFSEGDNVKPGGTLVEIEPERYKIAVASAAASLKKAEAAKKDAEDALLRRKTIEEKNPGLIVGEEIQTWQTRVATASAEVMQAKSALQLAELNLRDAFVRSPAEGKIQTRTVQTGEYVQPGAVLATLVKREPLLLKFSIPSQDIGRVKNGMRAHFKVSGIEHGFKSKITYIADAADAATRLVSIIAHVDDSKRNLLRPGMFAEVTVPFTSEKNAIVIPQTAIRPTERGFIAFVAENNTANERLLTLGMRTVDGRVEVKAGLQKGDNLIIRGAEALKDGVTIKPEK